MPFSIPSSVKGSTELDRDQFIQTLQVPFIIVPVDRIQSSKWKEILLIAPSLKNVRDLDPPVKTEKQILFDPEKVQNKNDLIERIPTLKEYIEKTFDFTSITINYTNYTIEQVIKAILPDDLMLDKRVNNGSGYSLIGHIAHFNLRDEVLPYKRVIGNYEICSSDIF